MVEWLTGIRGQVRNAYYGYLIVGSSALLIVSLIAGDDSVAILSGLALFVAVARVVHLARARNKGPAPDDGWGKP